MTEFISVADVQVFAPDVDPLQTQEMITDATALALMYAPCIGADGFAQTTAVKAILRGAILRWRESGTGALQSQQAGPFGQTLDTRQERRGMFWPSEIQQLQGLCGQGATAFSLDLSGP